MFSLFIILAAIINVSVNGSELCVQFFTKPSSVHNMSEKYPALSEHHEKFSS